MMNEPISFTITSRSMHNLFQHSTTGTFAKSYKLTCKQGILDLGASETLHIPKKIDFDVVLKSIQVRQIIKVLSAIEDQDVTIEFVRYYDGWKVVFNGLQIFFQ